MTYLRHAQHPVARPTADVERPLTSAVFSRPFAIEQNGQLAGKRAVSDSTSCPAVHPNNLIRFDATGCACLKTDR
jgi:hypothetical protein